MRKGWRAALGIAFAGRPHYSRLMELTDDAKVGRQQGSLVSTATEGWAKFRWLAPARRFDPEEPEWIDRAGTDAGWLREELQVMAHANERCGTHQLILGYLENLLPKAAARPVTVLDLGTGAADIPRAMAAWFRERRQEASITAVDRNPEALRMAAELSRDWPEVRVEQHDLLALPFEPGSFDVVHCSQALHHFSMGDAVKVLRRAWEICRAGCVITDLRRNWASVGLVQFAAHTFIKSPIIRHDALQSCRAAFTVEELRALAARAGMNNLQIHRHQWPFRMVLCAAK